MVGGREWRLEGLEGIIEGATGRFGGSVAWSQVVFFAQGKLEEERSISLAEVQACMGQLSRS